MPKYTTHTLKKLLSLFEELAYTVRFEKGNFQSGYCIVENKKIVIVNKFYELDGKINTLIDILSTFDLTNVSLSEASEKFLSSLKKEAFDDEN